MVMWMKNAPLYSNASEDEIVTFVDKHVSCSSDVKDEDKPLLELQRHKPSQICRKKGKSICHFGFPLPAMP